MGGIAYTLAYQRDPAHATWDPSAFQRDVWGRIDTGIRARVKSRAARDIVTIYLADEASDGFVDQGWFAGPTEMMFVFGDAAGLCTREMYVSEHLVSVIALDAFDDLQRVAHQHGATLAVPGAKAGESADATLRRLLSDGQCACEVCASLRADRGLPEVPKPAPAPKKTRAPRKKPASKPGDAAPAKERPAPAFGVFDAPLQLWPSVDVIRAAPSEMVAVDVNANHFGKKPPAAVFRALETCPLRALVLRRHGMRSLWAEATRYPELEILSLRGCGLRVPLGSALLALPALRALDLRDNPVPQVYESLELPPELEIADVRAKSPGVLEGLVRLPRLRTMDISSGRIPELAYDRPIDTLWLGHGIEFDRDGLRALPLRFVSSWDPSVFANTRVEHYALPFSGLHEVPEGIRSLANVRALYLGDMVASLPEWLTELPQLTTLFVGLAGADVNPKAFRVLERMTNLRVLAIRALKAAALPLDFSALEALRVFALHDTHIRELDGFPRGLDAIATLRAAIVGGQVPHELVTQWSASVPSARYHIAMLSTGEPLDYYRMSLPRGTYDHFLSRCTQAPYTDLLEVVV
jgi:hypothetical protein